ncbi:UDP-N-acetylglucosamine 2-epimerase [Thalassobacillus pellis]|uniref:UDP-N-acetylglucosamine 2-epimerase n=1 Tax=Thalassobacillus pellis TaxID=748008 RepID=UPI0019620E99|nr:UDP-N-acetylglucosamine 2-epimerase [Thalassobacillus pellis]MBM7552590.1 UDP-hydrolyzing UDP-N-acetyl-D-glucosamine 2-epimerase [Thalassobacillus pellis]
MKKIICFTGTRADYGIYRPLLLRLEKEKDIDLQLVVTGMHVVEEYGSTIKEIEKDDLTIIAKPPILLKGDSKQEMAQSVGTAIILFSSILYHSSPDGVLLLGDRGEMLAAVTAAHYQNIKTFHLHGGEKSGSADDAVRHAVSKLATYHFPATNQSKERLIKMGEDAETIAVSGSLRKHDITAIQQIEPRLRERWQNKFNLSKKPSLLFVMHPDSKDSTPFQTQIDSALQALRALPEVNLIILGSNSDAGGGVFRQEIKKFTQEMKNVLYYESLPPDEYLFLLSQVDIILGNSSSGIIEAPFFQLPYLLIGKRQLDREHGGNVYVAPYISDKIERKIRMLLDSKRTESENPYDVTASPADTIVSQLKKWL